MDDLVTFLRARLDEDEAVARRAPDAPWFVPEWGASSVYLSGTGAGPLLRGSGGGTTAAHVVRHQPARVLAEVRAKRWIVELHQPTFAVLDQQECQVCLSDREPYPEMWCGDDYPCPTLRLLAAPFASHQDYRTEWAPPAT